MATNFQVRVRHTLPNEDDDKAIDRMIVEAVNADQAATRALAAFGPDWELRGVTEVPTAAADEDVAE